MATNENKAVTAYIDGCEPEVQNRLATLRDVILSTLPDQTEETTAWGMPTYRYKNKNRIHFATFKHHVGLFVGADVIERLGNKLKGYTTTKAVIHLTNDKPLPVQLIKAAVKKSLETDGIDSTPKKRVKQTMPEFVESELKARGLTKAYDARPPYQRNDYLSWISSAKQEATQQRRLEQMLVELEAGDKYMGMDYRIKSS